MAHGERAERQSNRLREFCSRRWMTYVSRGPAAKLFTHRHERRQARRAEREAMHFARHAESCNPLASDGDKALELDRRP